MNSLVLLLAAAVVCIQAKPNMTPAQQAQFDQQKTQLIQRMSPTAQQAAMRMDQMEQQIDTFYNQQTQATKNELDSFHRQMDSMMYSMNSNGMNGQMYNPSGYNTQGSQGFNTQGTQGYNNQWYNGQGFNSQGRK